MKTCPFCAEEIQDKAIKCKHCGSMLTTSAVSAAKLAASPKAVDESLIGGIAIVCYLIFAIALMWAAVELGGFAAAMMVTWAFIWSLIAQSIGKKKGRPSRAFLLGLLLGPLGLLVVVLQD